MFKNRQEAGKLLAGKLGKYLNKGDVIVLGIPRGGVVVAKEVAEALKAPLDIIVIKKIGYPGNEELALGAAGLDDFYLNKGLAAGVPKNYIDEQVRIKQEETRKRYEALRGKKQMYFVENKTIIIADDGIATGATMIMAIKMIRRHQPKKIIAAVPVAPPEAINKLKDAADEVVCLDQPYFFTAIGEFYQDFRQVEDEEVKEILEGAEWTKKQRRTLRAR